MVKTRQDLVLVVDDEPVIRRLLRQTLEIADYAVLEASDGLEAISVLEARQHRVAAILSDITMPRMDGLMLVSHVHEQHPNVPVVLASGMHSRETIPAPIDEIIKGFLQKPYTPASVLAVVGDVVGRSVAA